jgi:hypothetical protein
MLRLASTAACVHCLLPAIELLEQANWSDAEGFVDHDAAQGHMGEAGESEGEIQRALFVGNYAAALDICLQARARAQLL